MKTNVLEPKRTGGLRVPVGPDPTRAGYTRSFVPGFQHDEASPGGGPLQPPGPSPVQTSVMRPMPNSPLAPPKALPDPSGFMPTQGPLTPQQLSSTLSAQNAMSAGGPALAPYAQRLTSGQTPFSDPAAAARYGAATARLNAPAQPAISPAIEQQIAHDKLVTPGNFYNSMLPGYQKLGAQPVAQHDFGLKGGQFPADKYQNLPNGMLAPKGYSESPGYVRPPEQQQALDRLKSPERQQYLDKRKAAVAARLGAPTARTVREGRQAEAQQRGFEQQLGVRDPRAYGQLQYGRGQQALASSQMKAAQDNITAQRKFQGEQNDLNRKSAEDRTATTARGNILAHGGTDPLAPNKNNLPPIPALGNKPPEVHNEVRKAAADGDIEGARKTLIENGVTDKSEQNKILQDATGDPQAGLSFWDRPVTPPLGPMAPGITRGDAANRALHGIFGVKPGEKVPKAEFPKKSGKWGLSPFPPFYAPK